MNDFSFYFGLGWEHIMSAEALDHILFIAALAAIYMLKDWKQVLILVTAFTVGHTITLVLSTKEMVTVDSGIIEFLIPCTIAITAIFNLFQKKFTPKTIQVNYFLALFFGLIHGLAFANLLRMLLATNQSFALSMVSFSVGLETGQILIVLSILLLSQLLIGVLNVERRHWVIFLSAAVFSLSVQMALERWPGHTKEETAALPTNLSAQEKSKNAFWSTGTIALMKRQWQSLSGRMRDSVQLQNTIEHFFQANVSGKNKHIKNTNNT